MRITIGVNTLSSVNSYVYSNHIAFLTKSRQMFPKDDIIFFSPDRMSIDNMRNEAARYALQTESDYLMFIDDDVLVPPNCLKRLIEINKDIVMGLTMIRGYPFRPMFFKDVTQLGKALALDFYENYRDDIDSDGLVNCYAIGFSCVLIKTEILKKVTQPYFVTSSGSIFGGHTEDVYFCCKCKAELEDISIVVDTKTECGHLLDPIALTASNAEICKRFYKELDIVKDKEESNPDLGYDKIKEQLACFN